MFTIKYFENFDVIDESLIQTNIISGNMGNLLRAMVTFIHQALVNVDSNLYTIENIEKALCRHPELTIQLCESFKWRFDPNHVDINRFEQIKKTFLAGVHQLDTGQESHDNRRKMFYIKQ